MAALLNPQTVRQQVMECPACKQPIWARVALEVAVLDSEDPNNVVMSGKIIGFEVAHDCMPRQGRGSGGQG